MHIYAVISCATGKFGSAPRLHPLSPSWAGAVDQWALDAQADLYPEHVVSAAKSKLKTAPIGSPISLGGTLVVTAVPAADVSDVVTRRLVLAQHGR